MMKQRAESYWRNRQKAPTHEPPRRRLLSVLVAQALSVPLAAQASSVEVTSTADDDSACTLREAIMSVNTGSASGGCTQSGAGVLDEITFGPSVSGATITLTNGQIAISEDVAVNPGGAETTIDADGNSRIFVSGTPNIQIDLQRLVLTGGNSPGLGQGGAVSVEGGLTLNLIDSTVSSNTTAEDGGGISAALNASLTLTNSTVSANSAGDSGGGIYAASSTVTLTDSTVSGNTAVDAGGVYTYDSITTLTGSTVSGNTVTEDGGGVYTDSSTIALTGSTVSGNTADKYGGGIFDLGSTVSLTNSSVSGNKSTSGGGIDVDGSNVSLTGSTVSGNTAVDMPGDGGGIVATDNTNITLTDSTVSDNSADAYGGGFGVVLSTATVMNSTISGNSAGTDGGGIYAYSGSVDLTNSTMSGNTAAIFGGGINAEDNATVVLTDSTVSGNSAGFDGGGITVVSSSVALANSTVSGSTASDDGGGISAFMASVEMTNSTISGNSAADRSGGMVVADSFDVILTHSTVSDNSAGNGYGGIYANSSSVTLVNSIVANSQGAGSDCEKTSDSAVTALTDSIIDDDACGTGALNDAPGLLPLAANGGPTETHALKPGSPAIDAPTVDNSVCPAMDQRGVDRDDGNCDVGAYEFAETVLPIAFQDRAMGVVMSGADQWYRFNAMTPQRVSMQTNGFGDDTRLELYTGTDPKQATNLLADDDDAGPEAFTNIRADDVQGNHLIRVIGNPEADPFFLRLMSAEDILTFADAQDHFAATAIRVMSAAGITGGCGQGAYCPNEPVTRAQMALFLIRAIQGGNHVPPPATGSEFGDVGANSFGANAIEEFSTLGITAGCGGGNYCPDDPVTREQMAVFLLRALFGAGHTPPQATPAEINQFTDISDSFARDWIVQLVDEGITGGCGGNQFCPADPVTRGQMAAFIQRTFDLDTDL